MMNCRVAVRKLRSVWGCHAIEYNVTEVRLAQYGGDKLLEHVVDQRGDDAAERRADNDGERPGPPRFRAG